MSVRSRWSVRLQLMSEHPWSLDFKTKLQDWHEPHGESAALVDPA